MLYDGEDGVGWQSARSKQWSRRLSSKKLAQGKFARMGKRGAIVSVNKQRKSRQPSPERLFGAVTIVLISEYYESLLHGVLWCIIPNTFMVSEEAKMPHLSGHLPRDSRTATSAVISSSHTAVVTPCCRPHCHTHCIFSSSFCHLQMW